MDEKYILDLKPSKNRTAKVREGELEKSREKFDKTADTKTGENVREAISMLIPGGMAVSKGRQALNLGRKAITGSLNRQAGARASIQEALGNTRSVGPTQSSRLATYPAPAGGRGSTFMSKAEIAEGQTARRSAREAAPWAGGAAVMDGYNRQLRKKEGSKPIDLSGEELDLIESYSKKSKGGVIGVGKALRGYGKAMMSKKKKK